MRKKRKREKAREMVMVVVVVKVAFGMEAASLSLLQVEQPGRCTEHQRKESTCCLVNKSREVILRRYIISAGRRFTRRVPLVCYFL